MILNKIRLLENSLINKIAAGEVVERPLSVVKELIENSIDAGASNISIEIKHGGIEMIRITDNGRGIPSGEVKTAFMRHATSKISDLPDLENIITLGFRGEALSSIASVSQIELVTRTEGDIMGKRIEIHGGKVISEQDIGSVIGTTIIMRNLFYNVPARFKFLKKPAVESGYISDLINKLALGRPDISFKYINNSTISLQTNGNGKLSTVIAHVYGKDVAGKLLELRNAEPDSDDVVCKLFGYVGKPEIARGTRSGSNIFINGRYVKSDLIQQAVEEAYKTKLMTGKFPIYILNIEINPNLVDVNVHPAKTEVRFSDEELIYDYIKNAVINSLKDNSIIPETRLPSGNSFAKVLNEDSQLSSYKAYEADVIELKPKNSTSLTDLIYNNPLQKENTKTDLSSQNDSLTVKPGGLRVAENPIISAGYLTSEDIKAEPKDFDQENTQLDYKPFFEDYRIVGQVFNTYWIVEHGNSIYLIDQHAAHERILYEDLMGRFKNEDVVSQTLLQPIIVHLSQNEMLTAEQNLGILQKAGFDFEEFGENILAIRSVPYIFGKPAEPEFFLEILDKLAGFGKAELGAHKSKTEIIASISCKAAVKANDKLSFEEARAMIESALKLENPFTCPHGRPTIIELTHYELEKRFKRV